MSLDDLTTRIRSRANAATAMGKRIKLSVADGGVILIDGTGAANAVSNSDADADATVSLTAAILGDLMEGRLEPAIAYVTGRVKISGDVSAATRLGALLDD